MKLSSGKLQFWEWDKTPVGAGTFFPFPILLFYIPPWRKCLLASGDIFLRFWKGEKHISEVRTFFQAPAGLFYNLIGWKKFQS